MATSTTTKKTNHRVLGWMALLLFLTCMWVFVLWQASRNEQTTLEKVQQQVEDTALAFAEHTSLSIREIDNFLLEIRDDSSEDSEFLGTTIQRAISRSRLPNIRLVQIAVTDQNGIAIFSTAGLPKKPLDLSDREHIKVHHNSGVDQLFVSRPVLGRASGKWSIQFTRPYYLKKKFAGVIVYSADPSEFVRFYDKLHLGQHGLVAMVRNTGEVMSRSVALDKYIGKAIDASQFSGPERHDHGTYTRIAPTDRIERVSGYYRLPEFGVTLIASMSLDEALHTVTRQNRILYFATALLTVLLVLMVGRMLNDFNDRVVSEQRLVDSEARFRDFSESTSDWFWESDAEGKFFFLSTPSEKSGLPSWNKNLGKTRGELMREGGLNSPELIEQHETQLRAQRPFRDFEYRLTDGAGKLQWASVSGVPVFDKEGRFAGYRGVAQLVTQRKEDEKRLADAMDAAEAASRAKSEFLSSMSHELRTPLNSVLGYAQLLEMDSNLTTDQRENIREIESGGRLLLALVEEVLDLSRIESGKLDISPEPIPIEEIIAGALRMVTDKAEKARVTIIDGGGDGRNAVVQADRMRLTQVILNFLTNAIKYNREGGNVRLVCTVRGNMLCVAVSDTGPGIPVDKQSRVFSAFDRLGYESGAIEGTGIGLLICKRIVEAMGGTIGFVSAEGQGSTFWAEFPLANDQKPTEAS